MEGLWNFPASLKNERGVVYYPTRAKLPLWVTVAKQNESERQFSLGEIKLTRISPKFDLAELGLSKSPLFSGLPVALDSSSLLPLIKREIPEDRVEVVEWMQRSAADNAILTARMEEYNRYSRIDGSAGDGYIPGVRVSDVHFISRERSEVANLGYGELVSPQGRARVIPLSGKALITPNLLAWGAIDKLPTSYIQWPAKVLKWRELASTPIRNTIGFPSFAGIVAPNFFTQSPDEESKRVRVRQVMASDKDQRMPIYFRSPSNYTKIIDEQTIHLSKGTTEIEYIIASYPSVPSVIFHAQPENGRETALNEYYVEAI